MKRQIGLALCILALLFLSSPIFGGAGGQLITTYSTATTRISYVNGSAFFWVDGQDLSAYADPHYKFEIVDAEGDKLTGVGLTVGGGETLGSELVTDGGFAAVTISSEVMPNQVDRDFSGASGWTNTSLAAYDETDDLTITANATGQYCSLGVPNSPTTVGNTYVWEYDLANIVAGWSMKNGGGTTLKNITVGGVDQQIYFVAISTGGYRIAANNSTSSGDFDNFSLKQITFDNWTAGSLIAPGASAGALTNKASFAAATASLTQSGILTDSALHKIVHTLDYTSGTSMKVYAGTTGGTARASDSTFTEYLTAVGTDLSLTGVAITATEDDVSAKVVTDAPATGVQIVDAKGSTTRNWTAKDANFDFDEATYTVNVYRLDPVMIIQ